MPATRAARGGRYSGSMTFDGVLPGRPLDGAAGPLESTPRLSQPRFGQSPQRRPPAAYAGPDKAIRRAPHAAQGRYNRGLLYRRAGDTARAGADEQRPAKLDPRYKARIPRAERSVDVPPVAPVHGKLFPALIAQGLARTVRIGDG